MTNEEEVAHFKKNYPYIWRIVRNATLEEAASYVEDRDTGYSVWIMADAIRAMKEETK